MEGKNNEIPKGIILNDQNLKLGTDNPAFAMVEHPQTTTMESKDEGPKTRGKMSKISMDFPINGNEIGPSSPEPGQMYQLTPVSKNNPNATELNFLSSLIVRTRCKLSKTVEDNRSLVKKGLVGLGVGLFHVYFIAAVVHNTESELPMDWCDGLGLLIILTGIIYWSVFYYVVLKGHFGQSIDTKFVKRIKKCMHRIRRKRWMMRGLGGLTLGGVVTFIVVDCWGEPSRLISAAGYLLIIFIATLVSTSPGDIRWRPVLSGLFIQFIFGLVGLRWAGGRRILHCISLKITKFLQYSNTGSSFVYGFAASGQLQVLNSTLKELVGTSLAIPTTFAFTSLSVMLFFSFFVQLLYHIGVMLWVVRKVGWLLHAIIGTSAAESMNAAANVFLGMTEAPLLIKPFIDDLTTSELHAVLTGGFATIAGTVMAAYIGFGVKADSLLSASVMAAPCALALSKLIHPETEQSRTTADKIKNTNTKSEGNALDAAAQGAIQGATLVVCIIANIVAFISFVAFLNGIIGWMGALVGLPQLSFEWILGKLFIPVALCIGINPAEAEDVALLLGLKTVVNEFVAYGRLQTMILSERSRRISEFALCGFANLASVGIQVGSLGSLAPNRRSELSSIVWRALFAGAAANLLNACIAGTLLSLDETIPTT